MAALGVIAVLVALTGAHGLQNHVQARAERGAIATARVVVSLVVSRNITDSDITSVSVRWMSDWTWTPTSPNCGGRTRSMA